MTDSLIGPWLCSLGFHEWKKWVLLDPDDAWPEQRRTCERCNKTQKEFT